MFVWLVIDLHDLQNVAYTSGYWRLPAMMPGIACGRFKMVKCRAAPRDLKDVFASEAANTGQESSC